MSVKELRIFLSTLEHQDREVEFAVGAYNKRHPVAYLPLCPDEYGGLQSNGESYRFKAGLPQDEATYMTIINRKKR